MKKFFDKKYGVDSDSKTINSFHKKRRMFVIKEDGLRIAKTGLSCTHAEWFEREGWMTKADDSFMDEVTRGYVDNEGIFFYKGYDFRVDGESLDEIKKILPVLIDELDVDKNSHLFGGFKDDAVDYGAIKIFL